MFNVKCPDHACNQRNVEFTFLGDEPYVRCGGCGQKLDPYNHQTDPDPAPFTFGDTTE